MKTQVQRFEVVWSYAGSLAAGASATSGSVVVPGYGRLTGLVYSTASLAAGSGVRVRQSPDDAPNWDYTTDNNGDAGEGAGFSIDLIGRAAQIELHNGADTAASVRAYWKVMPI